MPFPFNQVYEAAQEDVEYTLSKILHGIKSMMLVPKNEYMTVSRIYWFVLFLFFDDFSFRWVVLKRWLYYLKNFPVQFIEKLGIVGFPRIQGRKIKLMICWNYVLI